MTKEEKEVLIKDLCARLPYGVKAYVKNWSKLDRKYYEGTYTVESVCPSLNNVLVMSDKFSVEVIVGYDDYVIKPYLFPLTAITKEQFAELLELCNIYVPDTDYLPYESWGIRFCMKYLRDKNPTYFLNYELIEYLNKHHFDYNDLIGKGLALNAEGLNIY